MLDSTLLNMFHKGRNRNVPCVCGSGLKAKKCKCSVSMTAKRVVKDGMYADINDAVMEDADQFAETYNKDT